MRKLSILLFAAMTATIAWSQDKTGNLVLVEGGSFKNAVSTNYYGKNVTVSSFYVGQYEVTQKEWADVMGTNLSKFSGETSPVEMVTWYEAVDYCNKRSVKEGLKPYYSIDKTRKDPNNHNDNDEVKWTVTLNQGANGYRLPTEAEWEYAASGGQKSRNYIYSGGNEIDRVAWYWQNCGDKRLTGFWNWPAIEGNNSKPRPVGGKAPNELGLYDMSGNVREWCWDWFGDLPSAGADPTGNASGSLRVWRGGGWIGGDFCCELSYRAGYEQFDRGPDQGLRVVRSK